MKVIYDKQQSRYLVELENYEHITVLNTDDITEAREIFLDMMASLFNHAVNKRLEEV